MSAGALQLNIGRPENDSRQLESGDTSRAPERKEVGGSIITSRKPDELPRFDKAIIDTLAGSLQRSFGRVHVDAKHVRSSEARDA